MLAVKPINNNMRWNGNLYKVDCYIYVAMVLSFKGRSECSEAQGEAVVASYNNMYACSYGSYVTVFNKNCSRSNLSLYNKLAAWTSERVYASISVLEL